MTDINKLIEEEAKKYASNINLKLISESTTDHNVRKYHSKRDFEKGAFFILSKWQEAERWRKFGTDDLPKIGMRILLRVGERHDTTVICSHSHIHSISEVFTEWKPIS